MSISVDDPFGVASDPALPSLALVLNPVEVKRWFKRRFAAVGGEQGAVRLKAIRVIRYKPGRRCLIEYALRVRRPNLPKEKVLLIGKVRAKRNGQADFRLQQALWNAGFQADCPDGISVTEPIGVVPKMQIWLQRKVPGQAATDLLATSGATALAHQIAAAAHKLHRANVPTDRCHTMADELRILHTCLRSVAGAEPSWEARLDRLYVACERLGAATSEPMTCGIHRDFYADQIIVHEQRLYLLDFDLYCQGDPGLDIGNFLGHITEQSLRTLGDPGALADLEHELEERFVALSGEATRRSVRAYALLTLVRHIYLSTRFSERSPLTATLLELCEERLGVVARPRG